MKDHIEKKRVQCYTYGHQTKKSYNFTKQKWSRVFKCSKCGGSSFRWFNF